MFITTYQKRSTPYWLNFLYSGQSFNFYHVAPNATNISYIIQTSNTGRICHITTKEIEAIYDHTLVIDFYENPTVSNFGTLLTTVFNMDRRSAKTADTKFYFNPTVTADGTLFDEVFIVTANDYSNLQSVYFTGLSELVLKKNTNYLIKIFPDSQGTIVTNINFFESGN